MNLNGEVNGKILGGLPKLNDDNKDVINHVSRLFGFEKSLKLWIVDDKKKLLEIIKKEKEKELGPRF